MSDEQFVVDLDGNGERLDAWISTKIPDCSRSRCCDLIKAGDILLNGKKVKPRAAVRSGDVIDLKLPEIIPNELEPENIPLDILFEDDDMLALNKQPGLVVHPAAGNQTGTLVHGLLYHCENLSGINGVERPGIVHRLDKDTSGVMIVAKSDAAMLSLREQFSNRETKKEYTAITTGVPHPLSGTIEGLIGRNGGDRKKMALHVKHGKESLSHYQVATRYTGYSTVKVQIETGRTHQIRVHLKSIGTPVLGDTVYGGKVRGVSAPRQMLHATTLQLTHPVSKEAMTFEAPLPDDFLAVLEEIKGL